MKTNLYLIYLFFIGLNSFAQGIVQDTSIGCTYYDLQTNGSISNRLVVNNDGTISAAWITSPNSNTTSLPPYPYRGTGYNFWDGAAWINTLPYCPSFREETSRTGFTNIVVTSSGAEMTIAHAAVSGPGNHNMIVLNRRPIKGTGPWTLSSPWDTTGHDTWPKACSVGTTIYAIWQGSGAGAVTTSTPPVVAGQSGPIFFTRSIDDGINWDPKTVPALIDSNYYKGFGNDHYSIDARDSIVAISFGDVYTDVGLLKSTDYGMTWTKKIILTHPIPFYTDNILTDTNSDGHIDTLYVSSGDSKVLIDNNGMCHVWFSGLWYWNDSIGDNSYSLKGETDGLEYWNESMGTDNYVTIATAQDFNGNGKIDNPVGFDTSSSCINYASWGIYNGGYTIMPSAGIDSIGTIYLCYASIDEAADTTTSKALRRHIYMKTLAPPYNVADWTSPYDIIPSVASGGSGEYQEGAFACVGRHVDNTYAYVLYQRDSFPGHAQGLSGLCDYQNNNGKTSDIILAKIDKATVSAASLNREELFISQNYPNPANGITYINIGLRKSSKILFEVYDIVGKIVYAEKLQFETGSHTISFDTKSLETGIYNYSVTACGTITTRKMIVSHQ